MSIVRRIVQPKDGPKAGGPFSMGVIVDKTLYMSGQVGREPATGHVSQDFEAQAEQVMANIGAVLRAADLDYRNVVKTTVLLTDINDWAKFNTIYQKYFSDHPPARAAYQVAALPRGFKVEVEAIAVVGDIVDVD